MEVKKCAKTTVTIVSTAVRNLEAVETVELHIRKHALISRHLPSVQTEVTTMHETDNHASTTSGP